MARSLLVAPILAALLAGTTSPAAEPPLAESFLLMGELAEGEAALAAAIKDDPKDDQARFGLGVVQFLRAVEGRVQAFYRHGLRSDVAGGLLPLTNLPIPNNPKPEPIDPAKARALLQTWVDELAKVEATLSGITSPEVKLPLRFGRIKLDFDGDGEHSDAETLWKIFTRFNRQAENGPKPSEDFLIAFDRGDVDWLRGYCHLLSAIAELPLAHDFETFFRESGFLLFRGAAAPYPFLVEELVSRSNDGEMGFGPIADIVSAIHRVQFPVIQPKRLASVLSHLEATAALSRSSWKAILAETDNDREWVPNPRQTSVVGVPVTAEMIQGWMEVLDELEAILAGKTLVPFWRGVKTTRGVNLRRVLTEPRPFDLVLWVQGSAAAPYLEEGVVSSSSRWSRINRIFRGEFIGFAFWFN